MTASSTERLLSIETYISFRFLRPRVLSARPLIEPSPASCIASDPPNDEFCWGGRITTVAVYSTGKTSETAAAAMVQITVKARMNFLRCARIRKKSSHEKSSPLRSGRPLKLGLICAPVNEFSKRGGFIVGTPNLQPIEQRFCS